MDIFIEYTDLKNIINSKNLNWQFVEYPEIYQVFVFDGPQKFTTTLYKSGFEPKNCATCATDTTDFETNIIPIANKQDKSLEGNVLPPNTTRVIQTHTDLIAGLTDDLYVIPNGQTLTVQRLYAASSLSLGSVVGSKVEFFEDVAGDGVTLNLIVTLYTTGEMASIFINESFVGDGSRAIRTRRAPLDVGSREVYTRWEGYLR